MSFALTDSSSTYRQKVTVTPTERKSGQLREPAEPATVPDGVHLSSHALQGGRGASDGLTAPGNSRSKSEPQPAGFTPEEVQEVTRHTEGAGRWSSLSTESGVRGEVLEGSDGLRFKVLLPAGVLPEPVLIERAPGKLEARTLGADSHQLPVREDGSRVEADLQGARAVFDEKSYTFGMETPERLESDNTHVEREREPFLMPDGDGYHNVTYGTQTFRQNMCEYLRPDGSRGIQADRQRTYKYEQNGHEESISYYSIHQSPAGQLSAQQVVKGEDEAWFVESSGWDEHGTATHPLDVQKGSDGSYLLTPAGPVRNGLATVGNRLRNFGKMVFVGDQLQARPADLTVVRAFS